MSEMDPLHTTNGFGEKLTLYVFDLLEADELKEIEEHLSTCGECHAEVQLLREAASQLTLSLPDINPNPRVRSRVLEAISAAPTKMPEQPLPGVFVKRLEDQEWRKSPYPGVEFKILYVDKATSSITSLLKLEPGARYPSHRHAAVEQCLVLEGTVRIGQISLKPGDFEYANAGTEHAVIQSDNGCVLMIISNQHDEVFT